jgi:hypothetical protein
MSFDASGSIAGAVVFSKWRGRNYVRRHAVPSNPRSVAQMAARAIIAFLGADWKNLAANLQATWAAGAESLKISAFNEFIRINARNWRDQMTPSQATPAAIAQSPTTISSISTNVSGRQVAVEVTIAATTNQWGVAICRSLTSSFSPTPSNVIGIVKATSTTITFVDGPLVPDTYYYNAFAFTKDGVTGNIGTEDEAVVT